MIQNKRDLGGLKTQDGRTIKPGRLIRSAHLYQATEDDLKNISAVIDLRTPGERAQAPDQYHHCKYHPLPIFTDEQAGISHEQELQGNVLPDMAYLYGLLVNRCSESFKTVLTTIMKHDFASGAILWHCTEGKDRCGLTTAMILEMLGVDRKDILEDYLKTNIVNMPKAIRMSARALPTQGKEFADHVYQVYIADERYLQAAWDAMGEDYIERMGISRDDIERFRDIVLQ